MNTDRRGGARRLNKRTSPTPFQHQSVRDARRRLIESSTATARLQRIARSASERRRERQTRKETVYASVLDVVVVVNGWRIHKYLTEWQTLLGFLLLCDCDASDADVGERFKPAKCQRKGGSRGRPGQGCFTFGSSTHARAVPCDEASVNWSSLDTRAALRRHDDAVGAQVERLLHLAGWAYVSRVHQRQVDPLSPLRVQSTNLLLVYINYVGLIKFQSSSIFMIIYQASVVCNIYKGRLRLKIDSD